MVLTAKKQERTEMLLKTIDRLGVMTVRQLQRIHDLGSYRNACRIVSQLEPYLHVTRGREKIFYLNKDGRELIGSDKEVKKSMQIEHKLLMNEVYIHFGCPGDWRTEYRIEHEEEITDIIVRIGSGKSVLKKRVVADAYFGGNIIEIDNTRHMKDNMKKIENYREIFKLKKINPQLYFFTTTIHRKQKLEKWLAGMNHQVLTFDEIK
ncbi:replication-relaxation family protein [Bacillus smithii]|uniref:replication-relaxation family protein n=1 Tax=Bacillus smithii TaxID=1479 RepID=UPI002E24F77B|nr:replication-relaxation family protein [Bacillus smithii]MED1456676.1 replication-relaxation family protein [Bacillus smithii]